MRRIYAWEDWFARDRTVLVRGVHYRCSQRTMTQMIRNNASARGVRIRLADMGTQIVVEVVSREGRCEIPHTDQAPVAG